MPGAGRRRRDLPVRRHLHDKRDSVYAYRAELDAWWANRGAKLGDQDGAREITPVLEESKPAEAPANVESSEPAKRIPPAPKATRTAALLSVGLFLVLLVAAAWIANRSSRVASETPPVPFQARDWILVAGFENQTGDPALDEMVDYALERELSNSRSVNVVPQGRVLDVLKLMRRPPDIRVDAELGREICLRDGGIRTLVTGRIERAVSGYHLSVIVVDPRTGTAVASITEEAAGKSQLQEAVRRGSRRVREILGEAPALARAGEVELVKVTTPSLLALRLYSQAEELIADGKYPAAEELLRQAIVEDPEFASAHIHLAWAIRNQGKPREKFLPPAEIAYRLSDRTSERERYFIRGSYFDLSGRKEEAVAAYEALLSLYPDHFWGSNNLIKHHLALGRFHEAMRGFVRNADLRPKSFFTVHSAAWNLARFGQDPAQARLYVQRARDLVSPEVLEKPFAWTVAWLELFPAWELWLEGDAPGALAIATRFAEKTRSTPSPMQEVAFRALGNFFMAVGRLRSAEECFGRLSDPDLSLAMVSFHRGNRQEIRRLSLGLVARSYDVDERIGFLLARSGLGDRAERVLAAGERKENEVPGLLQALRGEVAMARGRTAEAIDELKKSQETIAVFGKASFFLGAETLATALARQGDEEGAVRVFEHASRQKRPAVFLWMSNGGLWTRNQFLLARLYRKVGRVADAEKIEAELTRLLAVADSDHPILVELKRLQAASKEARQSGGEPRARGQS